MSNWSHVHVSVEFLVARGKMSRGCWLLATLDRFDSSKWYAVLKNSHSGVWLFFWAIEFEGVFKISYLHIYVWKGMAFCESIPEIRALDFKV